MTPAQKTRLEDLRALSQTATFQDLRDAIGAEILFLNSITDVWVFINAFRIAQANCPEQTGEEISIMLSDNLRKELNLLARGASMIDNFIDWFTKSQIHN